MDKPNSWVINYSMLGFFTHCWFKNKYFLVGLTIFDPTFLDCRIKNYKHQALPCLPLGASTVDQTNNPIPVDSSGGNILHFPLKYIT